MTSESTPEALKTAADNIGEDIKQDVPGVIAHLESYGEWTWDELKKAEAWIAAKL